jgi:hypothetical protein
VRRRRPLRFSYLAVLKQRKRRSIQYPSTDCGGDDTVLWPNASSVRTGVPRKGNVTRLLFSIRGRTSREILFVPSGLEVIRAKKPGLLPEHESDFRALSFPTALPE